MVAVTHGLNRLMTMYCSSVEQNSKTFKICICTNVLGGAASNPQTILAFHHGSYLSAKSVLTKKGGAAHLQVGG